MKLFFFQIVIQAIGSLFAVIWGVMCIAGNLRAIQAAAELNNITWDTQMNIPTFYIFNHRQKAMNASSTPSSGKGDLENLE